MLLQEQPLNPPFTDSSQALYFPPLAGTGTLTVMLYVYNKAFGDLQVGYATALSFVVVVIAAALTLLQFRVMKDD